jgi:citrate lyase subunit beta/citryl-CoA lyase
VTAASRSLLFVPGDRPDRFDKAVASGADEVILDLEDAVAPAAKPAAREAVAAWLARGGRAMVRVNAADTPWHDDDLRMVGATSHASVMLPKAEVDPLRRTLDLLPGRRVVALLETVGGYMALQALAQLPGLSRIAFGSVDFSAESSIVDDGEALTAVRAQIVLASCHAGLDAPIDGVGVEFMDVDLMRADALRSRKLGFGGKLCIHPRQVAAVACAFCPSEQEFEWARRVIEAYELSGGAATSVDGKMVDKPVIERARRITAQLEVTRVMGET